MAPRRRVTFSVLLLFSGLACKFDNRRNAIRHRGSRGRGRARDQDGRKTETYAGTDRGRNGVNSLERCVIRAERQSFEQAAEGDDAGGRVQVASCVAVAVDVGVGRCWSASGVSGVQRHRSPVAAGLLLNGILFHSEIDNHRSRTPKCSDVGDAVPECGGQEGRAAQQARQVRKVRVEVGHWDAGRSIRWLN